MMIMGGDMSDGIMIIGGINKIMGEAPMPRGLRCGMGGRDGAVELQFFHLGFGEPAF